MAAVAIVVARTQLGAAEVLCATFWGNNLLVGAKSGLSLLDRSGSGKVVAS